MKIEIRIKYIETLNLEIIGGKRENSFPSIYSDKNFLFANFIEQRPPLYVRQLLKPMSIDQ
jgi:hypothetical protein